uniref:Conserved secreted protein n=1 Tax=Rhabditophanes sp. KR3021 TaxID=114890 RepID=A0AC35TGV8_9BILA
MQLFKACVLVALIVSASAGYSDSLARDIFWPMCAASYSHHPENCIANKLTNSKLVKQVTVPCDAAKNDNCSGFIAVDNKEKVILIIFRGTEGFTQLLTEGSSEVFSAPAQFLGGGVSPYFLNAFNQVWFGGLKDAFLTMEFLNLTQMQQISFIITPQIQIMMSSIALPLLFSFFFLANGRAFSDDSNDLVRNVRQTQQQSSVTLTCVDEVKLPKEIEIPSMHSSPARDQTCATNQPCVSVVGKVDGKKVSVKSCGDTIGQRMGNTTLEQFTMTKECVNLDMRMDSGPRMNMKVCTCITNKCNKNA